MSKIPRSDNGGYEFEAIFPGTSQRVAIGATSATCTNSFKNTTGVVRVVGQADCHILFGAGSLTAVGDGTCTFLPSGQVEYFAVTEGASFSVAVIEDAAVTGSPYLFITEAK